MSFKGWLALTALLAAPGWAAAEWSMIASTEAILVEFDPDLVRTQGPYAMAWTRTTFTVPRPVEGNADLKQQSGLQLHAIDCAAAASTIVGITSYTGTFGGGEAIERTLRPRSEWSLRHAPPGSLAELTIRLACAEISRRGDATIPK